jgi:hypothetical protein
MMKPEKLPPGREPGTCAFESSRSGRDRKREGLTTTLLNIATACTSKNFTVHAKKVTAASSIQPACD